MTLPCRNVAYVAEIYGVTQKTVRDWIKKGMLGHLRLPGGDIRIRDTDIQAFEERQWQPPQNQPFGSTQKLASGTPFGGRTDGRDVYHSGREIARLPSRSSTNS